MYKHLAQPNNRTFFFPTSLTASLNKQIYYGCKWHTPINNHKLIT